MTAEEERLREIIRQEIGFFADSLMIEIARQSDPSGQHPESVMEDQTTIKRRTLYKMLGKVRP